MTSIMHRSFADNMGFSWPPEIAYKIDGRPVTYAELKASKIEHQRRHLSSPLTSYVPVRRAAYLWTFFVPGMIYGGWHLYVRTIKDEWWIRESNTLALDCMTMFPCGLLPIKDNFRQWKQAFAEAYPRADTRQQGMAPVWVMVQPTGGYPSLCAPLNSLNGLNGLNSENEEASHVP